MIAAGFAFVADEPPVVVDWLPWSHTFGGNHNFNMVLVNGGSLYIDDGNPTPPRRAEDRAQSARDRADHLFQRAERLRGAGAAFPAPTTTLRQNFFSRLKVLFYAGAGLNQTTWDASDQARRRDHRRAHHLPLLARLDRNLAARARLLLGFRPARQYRPAGAGRRAQAGAERGQAGSAPARPAHHARLLAAGRDHARGLRRGRLLQDRRRAEIRRPRRPRQRPAVRRPHRRGLQALDRHLGQRRALARALHRPFRALRARRGVRRPRPRRYRGADVSRHRGLPPAGRPCRRGGARRRSSTTRACGRNSPSCSSGSPP